MDTQDLAQFDAVKEALGLPEQAECWRATWSATQAAYEKEGPTFLDVKAVRAACEFVRMSDEPQEAIEVHRAAFDDNAALKRLAFHCAFLFHRHEEKGLDKHTQWPMLPEALGPVAHLFYAYVLLAGIDPLRFLHHRTGVPYEITVDTLQDIERWMTEYKRRHGVWGFSEMNWLEAHFEGRLYELGRLQFEIRRYRYNYHFFRDTIEDRVVAFAPEGERFRTDGQVDGVNGIREEEAWEAHYHVGHKIIRGNPVTPNGRAIREMVSLPTVQWEPVLKPGAPSLGVFIPEGESITPEACNEAFVRANGFFAMYFPDHEFKCFETDTWLLDHQLESHLPPDSNIIRFMRNFYVLPSPDASDAQLLDRVFHGQFTGIESAPRETTLQRAIVEHMAHGGHWRTALGVIFPEDIEKGPAFYREKAQDTPWSVIDEAPHGAGPE